MHKQPIKKQAIVALVVGAIVLSFSFKSNFFEVAKQLEIYHDFI